MNKVLLGDICRYISSKISVDQVQLVDYVSTENLLQNKGGLSIANKLPSGKVTAFQAGDVLVSNIRPYFKKIWLADRSGGASNDVLIFRKLNDEIYEKYLYYILADDRFFSFSTSSASGSKMPRGDKTQIMNYPVNLPPLDQQKKIANILGSLDEKIELNRRMNKTLEQLGQALFRHYFVDNHEAKDWENIYLGDIVAITTGKGSTKANLSEYGKYPLYGANGIMGRSRNYLLNEKVIVTGRVGTLGAVRAVVDKAWFSDNVIIMKPDPSIFGYVFYVVCGIDYASLNRGSTQPLITQTDLKNQRVKLPPLSTLQRFENSYAIIFNQIQANKRQMSTLVAIRDSLLPKLISGEIEV